MTTSEQSHQHNGWGRNNENDCSLCADLYWADQREKNAAATPCAKCATYQHDASYHDDEDRYPSVTATLTCSHGVPLDECPDRDAHHERYPSVTDETATP